MSTQWWKKAVVYQIYPKSYMDSNGDGIGDLPGIISKLDYLKELGIGVIWFSPLYKSPQKDNGYDISDYRAIHDAFGTMEDFELLLMEAHARDIRIVMDLVVNHTSDQHQWFIESKSSKDNPYRDYYIWRDPKDGKEPTNWGGCFGGSAWEYDEPTGQYYLHQFVVEQPDLNWENETVRKEVYDMMNWWCEKGIDGFRMDVISLISKPEVYEDGPINTNDHLSAVCPITANGYRVHEYLQEMNREVLSKYDLLTVGETAAVTVEEAKKYAGTNTNELSMVFQFEVMDSDFDSHGKWSLTPMHLPTIKQIFSKWQTELEDCAWNSLYWENHDQPRIISRWGDDSPNGGFTTGTPWLAVNPNYTYINAANQVGDPDSVFSYYKKLIQLRKDHEIIIDGSYKLLLPEDENIYAYTRNLGDQKLLILCNFTKETLELPEELKAMKSQAKDVMIRNYKDESKTLRPYEAVVYWM